MSISYIYILYYFNYRSSAIEIVLDNSNNIDNGRDTQRVVLTKKQEIRLELARLGTKIDKMGLKKSNVVIKFNIYINEKKKKKIIIINFIIVILILIEK